MKREKDFQMLEKRLLQSDRYLIYGAGVVAYQSMVAIREVYRKTPLSFLVSDIGRNVSEMENIPVISFDSVKEEWKALPLLVATPEIYHEQIVKALEHKGWENFFCIDTHLEYCIMSRYFRKKGVCFLLEDIEDAKASCGTKESFSVFMAKSHKDVPLKKEYALNEWVVPVQAGSACTEEVCSQTKDNVGKNISHKNPDYCELTVTYWAWKNRKNRYKGLFHYRRILQLTENDLQKCITNNIDVVLPLPFVCYPNAAGQYRRYISEADRACLINVLAEISPEYLDVLAWLDQQPFFYNYNILVAKEAVFDDYAEWLFRILEHAEYCCESKGKKRHDRYAGYLGELLTTLYFMKNRNRLYIVHAEKKWMV